MRPVKWALLDFVCPPAFAIAVRPLFRFPLRQNMFFVLYVFNGFGCQYDVGVVTNFLVSELETGWDGLLTSCTVHAKPEIG